MCAVHRRMLFITPPLQKEVAVDFTVHMTRADSIHEARSIYRTVGAKFVGPQAPPPTLPPDPFLEVQARDFVRQQIGWRVFMMLPRVLLHRAPGGGQMSRDKLTARFETFCREWHILLEASQIAIPGPPQSQESSPQKTEDEIEQRALRAEALQEM